MLHQNLKGQNLHIARSAVGIGSPVGQITPGIEGELYFQSSTGTMWVSTAIGDINAWDAITKSDELDTSNFTTVLSSADDTEQKAFNTLDKVIDDTATTGTTNKTWSANKIQTAFNNIPKFWLLKGNIATSNDFPTLALVQNGWIYEITSNVTDNNPAKTNTGASFISGDEIAWNGAAWIELGGTRIWADNGTDIYVVVPRNINMGSGSLKDSRTSTGIYLTDVSNTSANTTNKTLIGAINELYNTKDANLSFSNGLTRSLNNISNDLVTGVNGDQIIVGGTSTGQSIFLKNNLVDNNQISLNGLGVLSTDTASYEALVVNDNDFPNKKYVDGAIEPNTLALIEHAGTGLNNPTNIDMIIQTGVNEYMVMAGSGYISNNIDSRVRVSWGNITGQVPVGDGPNYIRINASGQLDVSQDGSYNVDDFVELGYLFTGGGNQYIIAIINTPKYNSKFTSRVNDFVTLGIRAIVEDGIGVSVNGLGLVISGGTFHAILGRRTLQQTSNFTLMYNTSDSGWIPDSYYTPANTLNTTYWNDVSKGLGHSLIEMTTGYFRQDVVFRIPNGSVFVVFGQAEYASETLADKAPIATLPSSLSNVAIMLAKINVQKGCTAIEGDWVYDIRPYLPRVFGFGSASAGSVQSHHSLADLTDGDDHCFSEDTEIYTDNGFISYKNISNDENVLTLNLQNSEFEYQKINGKYVYNNFNELVSISTGNGTLNVTRAHRIIYKQSTLGTWLEDSAESMLLNDKAVLPLCSIDTNNILVLEPTECTLTSSVIPYNGNVWCVSVPNKTLVLRREGFIFVAGNTQYLNNTRGDLRYAVIGKGVTNGDLHDHYGGDGAQIDYNHLANLPALGTAASKNTPSIGDATNTEVVLGYDTRLSNHRIPVDHGNEAHTSAFITSSGAVYPNASIVGATHTKITYDSKGLVTSGSDATATDVGLGSVTDDAQIKSSDFPSVSIDSEIALFYGTSGKSIKRGTQTGILKATAGVLSEASAGTDFVAPNNAIVGATHTKITYDSKGLVTSGSDISSADVGLHNVTNDAQIKASNFPSASIDSEIALFSSSTGKVIKRATTTGILKATAGVLSAASAGSDFVSPNNAITAGTHTKISYDTKGLVTSGADATTSDIDASVDKRYVTDANLVVINNTSNVNTGDDPKGNLISSTGNIIVTNGSNAVIGTGTSIKLSATPEVSDVLITSLSVDPVLGNTVKSLSDYTEKAWNFNKNVYTETKDPTGFASPESVTVTYDENARTITLTGTVIAYWRGQIIPGITSGWISSPHPDVTGYYYLKCDGSAFSWTLTSWDFSEFQIAAVHYTVSNERFAIRETHGFMPWTVHKELHNVVGTYAESGGILSGYTLNSTIASQRRPDISQCVLVDEDLYTTNAALTSKIYAHHWLMGSTASSTFSVSNSDIVPISGNQPYYNEWTGTVWQKTLMPANTYQAIWLLALPLTTDSTSQQYSYLWVHGQIVDASFTKINALKPNNIYPGNIIQSSEFVAIQKVIIFYDGANWSITSVIKLSGSKAQQIQPDLGAYLAMVDCDDVTTAGDGTAFNPLHVVDGVFTNNAGHSGGQTVTGGLLTTEGLALHNNATDNQGIAIEADGTLSTNVATYEGLVTSDNDIPNKKYVDLEDALLVKTLGRYGGQVIYGGTSTGNIVALRNNTISNLGFTIQGSTGLLTVDATNYENLIVADNAIPNKKYIDDTVYIPLQQNIEMHGTGLVSGGAITVTNPYGVIAYSVAPGIGYISNSVDSLKRLTWGNITNQTTLGDGVNYIRINNQGLLDVTLDPNYSIDDYIELGYLFVGGGNTIVIEDIQTPKYVSKFPDRVSAWASYGVRALVQTGTGVSEDTTHLKLHIASGVLHINLAIYNLLESYVFTKMFNTADMGWVPNATNANYVDPGLINISTNPAVSALVAMTPGYWKKDVVFRTPSGNTYYIYGQAEYASEALAKAAPLPNVPDTLSNVAVYVAYIACQSTDTTIGSRLNDIRPYLPRVFGFGSASSGTVTSHHALSNLTDGDDHCFSEDTELLTDRGFVNYEDIKEDEKALTFNLDTENLEYQQIEGKYVYNTFKEMVSLKSKFGEILVTDKHRIIYKNTTKSEKSILPKWRETTAINAKSMHSITIPTSGLAEGNKVDLSNRFCELLGIIIAEGHFCNPKREGYGIQIYQNKGVQSDYIRDLLNELQIPYSKYERQTDIYYIKSDYARKSIRSFISEKNISEQLMELRGKQFRWFLSGLILGDGSVRQKKKGGTNKLEALINLREEFRSNYSYTYHSGDKTLIDNLAHLCTINGLATHLYYREGGFSTGCWSMTIRNSKTATIGKNNRVIPYSGNVWCVSVPNTTLVLRRNGFIFIAGNTQYYNEYRGDLRYAKLANGVTNGDAHDHFGGDGGTISYNNLSDKPFIPTPVVDAKYILQKAYSGLSNAQSLGALTTGVLKNTVVSSTGTLSIASPGTDYLAPNVAIVSATKTKVTYDIHGLITSGVDATTADIAASTNKNYVTDAQLVVVGNTSNTNTGDVSLATNNGLSLTNQVIGMGTPSNVTTSSTNNVTTNTHTHALTLNTVVAGTNTKISYDAKGLITSGSAATTADIAPSTDRNYVTDAQQISLDNPYSGIIVLPALTDLGTGSVTIGNNGAIKFFRTADASSGIVQKTNITGGTFTLTDISINYVYCDYASGNPVYTTTLDPLIFLTDGTKVPVYRIFRDGVSIRTLDYGVYGLGLADKSYFKDVSYNSFQRQSGLVLSTAATRISTVASGTAWFGITLKSVATNVSGTTGTLTYFYPVAAVWNKTVVSLYDSTYYSDGTNRQSLVGNNWVAKYFFRNIDSTNEVYYLDGNTQASQTNAYSEVVPAIPTTISAHSIYVGKIVIQRNATNGVAYTRSYDQQLVTQGIANHDDLLNIHDAPNAVLNEHYHLNSVQATVVSNTSGANSGDVTLAVNSGLAIASQVLNMGTPSTITNATTNSVTTNTHTHALTLPAIPTDISGKKYLVQTADAALPNAQAMGALGTGIVKNTTTTGVQSIALAGTDFVAPNVAIVAGTNTKITYDTKGLITSATSATPSDVGLSNVTNNLQLTAANNLSDVVTRQTALNNITAVSAATNEYLMTKDTVTGNAIWKINAASLPAGTTNHMMRYSGSAWVDAGTSIINDGSNVFAEFYENYLASTTTTTAQTVDWNTGGLQKVTLANTPVTFTFTAPTGGSKSLRLLLIQDATGDRTIILPTTVIFEDSIPPILNRAPAAYTILDFFYDGTNYNFTRPVVINKVLSNHFYSTIAADTDQCTGIVGAAISSGTTASVAAVAGSPTTKIHDGIVSITSSTTTNSGYSYMTNVASSHLVSGGDVFMCDFQMRTISVSTTTTYIGFHDATTSATPVDGVFINISNATLSGKTSSNSTQSTTGTTYPIVAATWYRAVIIVRYDAARVDYYLYSDAGALLWTNNLTTNLPTAAGRNCGVGFVTTNVGTVATNLAYVDYIKFGNQSNY